ncbi:hypothetical protein C0995_008123, partial [Termitomyces sp. Mi166
LSLQKQEEVHATSSTLPPTQEPSQWVVLCNKSKAKAKATEDDKDEEGEATQKLRKKLKDFMVLTKVAKAFLERQSKSSQFFVLEDYKGKGKAKALLDESEQTGAKQAFKLTELVHSNSDEEEEEDRVHIIKKIKHEHIEELMGIRKRKEIIELEDEEVKIVTFTPDFKTHSPSSSSVPKLISKLVVALASPVAGPSTALIVLDPASKPAAAVPVPTPAPVKSTVFVIKRGFIFKDSFMVRKFKLVGTEESGALIINQATEVAVTQETLQDDESSDEDKDEDGNDNEDFKDDDDNSDDDDTAIDIDSTKHPEET